MRSQAAGTKLRITPSPDRKATSAADQARVSRITVIDPLTGNIVLLFHPRKDLWATHFKFDDAVIVGITATGRATVDLLNMNARERVKLRARLKVL